MKKGWEIKKLGEVCDFQGGSQPPKDEWVSEPKDGYVRMLQIRDFTQNRCFEIEYVKVTNRLKYCETDDILLGRYGASVGKVLTGLSGAYNVAIMKTIPDMSLIRKDFFKYFLKSSFFQSFILQVSTMRAAQAGFSKEDIQDYSLSIPPLEEQERIVEELDCLSGVIEKKKQQLKELDALAQSIFYEMFGNPVENDRGWEVEKLGNKAEISSSKRIFANEYTDRGIPFYRGKEVTEKSKGNPISVELYISKERYAEIKLNYGIPSVGDILVTAVGTIGNIWVVDSEEPFYFKDGNVLWLKIKDGTNPVYFKYILTILIDRYKEMMANGCAYSALTIVNLKEMPTCVTPLFLQQQFADKIELIEKQKELIRKSIEEVEMLFNSRMEYYFG